MICRTIFPLALLIVLPLLSAGAAEPAAARISQYRPVFKPYYDRQGTLLAAIRQYRKDDKDLYLVLDPQSFAMRELAADAVLSGRAAGEEAWRKTPFAQSLARHSAPPHPLRNDGLRKAEGRVPGFFLTVDLCPATKPLDRPLFEATMALPQKPPIPLAVMISGLWIQRHEADLAWLKGHIAAGRLAITWGNHSFTHFYDPAAPLERNFLLKPRTDFAQEVLAPEQLLLERGLTPSPFFRFPGLVSDRRLVEGLRDLNLIPIGSNAWLAKGEQPREGSIILVHGNGNEPEGIRLLLTFYDGQREAIRRGQTALLPLIEAFFLP